MIRECGIYVLMGSKPMSSFIINSGLPETEKEYQKNYEYYLDYLQITLPKTLPPSYQEYKDSYEEDEHMHYSRLWENWKTKMTDYVGPHFQFVSRKTPFGEENLMGLFINTCSTLFTLTYYYHEFEQVNGSPFDPKQVLAEISDEGSLFWQRIFRNNYTQGLLFGYGPRNSFVFEWQIKNDLYFPRHFFQEIEPLLKKEITVSDLRLPSISVYSLGDAVLENYEIQRKEILAQFSNKDFETTIKQWLGAGISSSSKE